MTKTKEPIAIIGIGCRFPGKAADPQKFWELLCEGKDAIIDVPSNRWNLKRFYDPTGQIPGRMNSCRGGFLEEKWEEFDPEFFHISPREANFLDPQQRVLLEITWEALEDAGIRTDAIKGTNSSVFIGAFTTDWQTLQNSPFNRQHCDIYSGVNGSKTILSARLAHFFDLRGPCLTVDTACSSSLVAVHLACQSLWQNESEMALAGGVNAILTPETSIAMSKGRFLNPSGQCRSFDADAKGYVRGEGAGIVILKLLSAAIRDGDSIYALIRNTGVNQDGYTSGGITQPNVKSQTQLLQRVLDESGLTPSEIHYVEAHGTGTPIGDPTEAAALDSVLNHSGRVGPCWMGSVKTNIGHLEAAAGIAGLIKTALTLKNQQIPPNLHFENPNPQIPFDKYCLRIPQTLVETTISHASVNSFGYGGTNANAVLQKYEIPECQQKDEASPCIVPLSGRSQEDLKTIVKTIQGHLEKHPKIDLCDLAYTLSKKRTPFDYRLAIHATSISELKEQLANPSYTEKKALHKPVLAFVFTGMGPQWWGMGRHLLQNSPLFFEIIQRCDACVQKLTHWSLLEELLKSESDSKMDQPEVSQIANCALQIALTHVLKQWGVTPDYIIGHSIGEVAAAYAAGILTLEESLTVSYHRSRLQSTKKNQGTMLAVGMSVKDVQQVIHPFADTVSLAAENSPYSVTLAGSEKELTQIAAELEKRNIFNRFLKVNVAYHSHQMEDLKEMLQTALKSLSPKKGQIPFYSTVYGDTFDRLDHDYWWANMRQPVRFATTMKHMLAEGCNLMLEIGPHPVLSSYINDIIQDAGSQGTSLATLNRKKVDQTSLQDCLCGLYVNGYELKWQLINPTGKFIRLPTYPWRKKNHWVESEDSIQYRLGSKDYPFLNRKMNTPVPTWQVELNTHHFPWIKDHQIEKTTIFPAAGYIETAIEMHASLENTLSCRLEEVVFHQFLPLEENKECILQVSLDKENGTFKIYSQDSDWTCHATGKCFSTVTEPKAQLSVEESTKNLANDIYTQFESAGLHYGPEFQGIKKLWKHNNTAYSELEISEQKDYLLDPRLLDSAFQTLIGSLERTSLAKGVILPSKIQQVVFYKPLKSVMLCRADLIEQTEHHIIGNITLFDESGEMYAHINRLTCRIIPQKVHNTLDNWLYEYALVEKPLILENRNSFTWCTQNTRFMQELEAKGFACCSFDQFESEENVSLVIICEHDNDEREIASQVLRIAQQIESQESDKNYHLWIATQGLAGACLWGLTRVLRQEIPHLKCYLVDFDHTTFMNDLLLELEYSKDEEIFYEKGIRHTRKLVRASIDHVHPYKKSLSNYGLELKVPGKIDSLYLKEIDPMPPGDHEVHVQIDAASLNFKDLMKILGLLNEEALQGTYFGTHFGMECAGHVVSIGKHVKHTKVGDHVCVFMPNAFQSHVTINEKFIYPIPFGCTVEEAPIYVPFLTVLRALKEVAKLKKGETVLIHSATGAVGLAAIQYAKSLGARIIATAGSLEKRAYLKELGVDYCSDSRSLAFVEDVLTWTNGKGVNVVLNSLGGEFLIKSWSLLAPYGRFVEIGKKDISLNTQLPMGDFNRNTSFAAVDMDRMFQEEPQAIQNLLKEAFQLFETGVFKPLPIKAFSVTEAKEAFHYMAQSKHVGKIMLRFDKQKTQGLRKQIIHPSATYLVTGGLSGFGLMTANWLVNQGVRHLILISRRGASTQESQNAVSTFIEKGVNLKVAALDVADDRAIKLLIEECSTIMPPLKGIIHSAMVLKDTFIKHMTKDMMNDVIKPKIQGCLNLHHATDHMDLDFFVLYSSISSLVGNVGQANYAAANAFLDAFCHYRNRLGLPALTINWGALQTGVLEREKHVADYLQKHGISALAIPDALNALENLLNRDGQCVCADIQWEHLMKAFSGLKDRFEFSEFASTTISYSNMNATLLNMEPAKRMDLVVAIVREKVGKTLKLNPNSIERNVRLNTLGIDSLMTMELQSTLESEIGIKVPTMELMKGPTVDQLAQVILKQANAL